MMLLVNSLNKEKVEAIALGRSVVSLDAFNLHIQLCPREVLNPSSALQPVALEKHIEQAPNL